LGTSAEPSAARRSPKRRARRTIAVLAADLPEARCALVHAGPYQLLVATILSAQCTDERVNQVTPEVFRRWPAPADLAAADPGEVEDVIRPTGFFRSRTRSLQALSR